MNYRNPTLLVALLACGLASPVAAQPPEPEIDPMVLAAGYLAHHPDVRNRREGFEALRDGLEQAAFAAFKRAARHADKPSQAMLGHMLWNGIGVARDRPQAYAWMDLAAERHYPRLLIEREKYWAKLSAAERRQAIEVGQPLLAEFGDAAAKPRMARELRRGARARTGSRTGGPSGRISIIIPGGFDTIANLVNNGNPGGGMSIDASEYYRDRYWQPEAYWAWQDELWGAPNTGEVDVGAPARVRGDAAREDGG